MKTLCFIRFGNFFDNDLSMTLGLLSCEPIQHAMKCEGVIITIFKTQLDIEKCTERLKAHGYKFTLLDITTNIENTFIENYNIGYNTDIYDPSLINDTISDEEREKLIFDKIKNIGVESLTQEEHNFMKARL